LRLCGPDDQNQKLAANYCIRIRGQSENLFMKIVLLLLFTLAFGLTAQAQSISPKDLKSLEGKEWIGTLNYLDYTSNKKISIKSNVTITRPDTKKLTWLYEFAYPDEPKANSKEELVLSVDGKTFDGETVIANTKLPGGGRRIVTTKAGKDNDRPATYRLTYDFTKKRFSVRKDVRIDGAKDYFERNTYTWTR